jgi:predicted hydrocarbon binding protein
MPPLHLWIATLIKNLECELDTATEERILENCGRNCIPVSFIEIVKDCWETSDSLDEFVDVLRERDIWYSLSKRDDGLYVIYPQCYCSLFRKNKKNSKVLEEIPSSFCYCSKGWLKELFENVFESKVEIEILETIIGGGIICKFRIGIEDVNIS